MITSMNTSAAKQICSWKYEPPYSVYNYISYKRAAEENTAIVNPEKADDYLCFWQEDILVAYVSIILKNENVFLGIGLAPQFCGKGLGSYYLQQGIEEAIKRHPDREIWLQVRSWNERAIRCYEKCGFVKKYTEDVRDGTDNISNFTFMCLNGDFKMKANKNCETISQYSEHYCDPPKGVRRASRGLVIDGDKILLSYEVNTDVYMSPGGGLEVGETLEECCVRELLEETGYIVKPVKPFVIINEYCFETMYESNYFICEIIGTGERTPTDSEIEHGTVPVWMEIGKALEIFKGYASKSEDIGSLYRRELTVLNKYLGESVK